MCLGGYLIAHYTVAPNMWNGPMRWCCSSDYPLELGELALQFGKPNSGCWVKKPTPLYKYPELKAVRVVLGYVPKPKWLAVFAFHVGAC